MKFRTCKKCGETFLLQGFPVKHRESDGSVFHRYRCKECYREDRREKMHRRREAELIRRKTARKLEGKPTETKECNKCGELKNVLDFPCYSHDGTKYKARCKACIATAMREWNKKNPVKVRRTSKKHYVKVDRFKHALRASKASSKTQGCVPCIATVSEIEKAFTGRCEICGIAEKECKWRLHLDHDHGTGEFRGWLCRSCNSALGFLKDSPDVVHAAAEYLNRHTYEQKR